MKNNVNKFLFCSLLIFFQSAIAQPIITNLNDCKNFNNSSKPFVLVLASGASVMRSILICANNANLTAATVTGVGLIKNPSLGYYNSQTRKIDIVNYSGTYELISLMGTLIKAPGRDFADIHVTLGTNQYQALVGHLAEATAVVRTDIIFTPLS